MRHLIIAIVMITVAPAGADAPINTLIPQIKSLDYPVTGTKMTLTADVGRWANVPTDYAYNWRTIDGSDLGKGRTLTFDTANPGVIGSPIVLEVTAKNAQGATIQASHWFGPIGASPPVAPVENETLPSPREEWPIEPAHFLQNGHAIFPGCEIPPPDPTGDHVWVFDPINGRTETEGATGHADKPFRDLTAFFNGGVGYAGVLWKRIIQPGDTIYLRPGWGGPNPIGDLIGPQTNIGYSTDDAGAIRWTWIMGDPAAASRPVLHQIRVGNGNGSVAGFIFKGFNVEQYRGANLISVGFNNNVANQPTHDVHFEDISVSGWLGHSNDPWAPSHYPTSGGTSDGTVLTASPLISPNAPQDPVTPTATAAKGSTRITLSAAAKVGDYIWSPGYYRSGTLAAGIGGIPNGAKVVAMNGLEATIAPCDPVADAATGCPTEPIPGCDPIVSVPPTGERSGGCPNGPAPWSGTTRALNGEKVSLTDSMTVLPAGYFNSTDWEMAYASGFRFAGQLDRAGSVDQANPNLLKGMKCLSIKDSMIRNLYNGIQLANVTNSVIYNNKIKWVSGDLMDAYTTHRIWFIHNYAFEPTLIWAHQDGIQFGDTNGNVAIKYYYNNAVIENEFIQHSDDTNPFPRPMQGVNTTENYHWGMYVCCNVIEVDNNALTIAGKWGAVVHNTVIGNVTSVGHQRKSQGGIPQDLTATHHLLANNIGNGVSRDSAIPDYCDPAHGDLNSVKGNFSLPFLPLSGAASVYCDKAGAGKWDAAMGVYQGLTAWSLTDWRPMFAVDLHPNPDFKGFTGTIALSVAYAQYLPSGYPDGTYATVNLSAGSGAPAGVWKTCSSCSTNANGSRIAWEFVQPDFNPPIIGVGVNLGAQQPIADHDGRGWINPPTPGAYENHKEDRHG